MGSGCGYLWVLRQHQPRLAVKKCPNGNTGAAAMVKGTMVAVLPMDVPTTKRVKGIMAIIKIESKKASFGVT